MPPRRQATKEEKRSLTRIAIINEDRCNPNRCQLDCKRGCPVNTTGKRCISVTAKSKKASISEILCMGCGICPRRCPFKAISIINIPTSLSKDVTHRYGPNTFKLHRLPLPRPGTVLGLVGINGIGKSTALKILRGRIKPNFGEFVDPPEWSDILKHYRGSSLQNFFGALLEDKIRPVEKAQYVDTLAKVLKVRVGRALAAQNKNGRLEELLDTLQLRDLVTRRVSQLSGGELQRFALCLVALSDSNCYLIDEPTSYLDVRQRLIVGALIRSLVDAEEKKYCVLVEHDLAVLDYVSDNVSLLYGIPGAYGVVTAPYSVRDGINIFLDGYIPTENMRFRDEPVVFRVADAEDEAEDEADAAAAPGKKGKGGERKRRREHLQQYPAMTGVRGSFVLHVERGSYSKSEIVVLVGQNGCGKSTLIRMLIGLVKPAEEDVTMPKLSASYKPQTIAPSWESTVEDLLQSKLKGNHLHPMFQSDIMKPLDMEPLMDRFVQNLSGGELQRTAITLALGKPANVYLLDEPSAYLDSEQRLNTAKAIKRFIMHSRRTAFIVEHDFLMTIYMADRIIVYSGRPGAECTAHAPQPLVKGMNQFLRDVSVTFRRDMTNLRPRINKIGSVKDREQKARGQYFATSFMDE
eukprot:gnl/Chilomastix_cuspidata/112.p1 GENE.gnl/Chilomastix_cuspidata/112~~gnl/Chilomastix_cuspidata/112.p1  ORF type:complete len:635 (+),score=349.09 gnl/Chilomastix_cuspidata/112:120-2024(+)